MKSKYTAFILATLLLAGIIVFGNIFLIKSVEVVFEKTPNLTNQDTIVYASQIVMNTNIFTIDEDKISKNIVEYYPNNSVAVLDIERKFPNKVIIYVKERKPLLIVSYETESGSECIPTDINFQMTARKEKSDIDFVGIKLSGITVTNTFNLPVFKATNEILKAFIELDFNEDGIATFIKEIKISSTKIEIILRNGDTSFELSREKQTTLNVQTKQAYARFLALSYQDRTASIIKP